MFVAWKRGFPQKFARFVLFHLIKKCSFNLLYVLDLTVKALSYSHGQNFLVFLCIKIEWKQKWKFKLTYPLDQTRSSEPWWPAGADAKRQWIDLHSYFTLLGPAARVVQELRTKERVEILISEFISLSDQQPLLDQTSFFFFHLLVQDKHLLAKIQ